MKKIILIVTLLLFISGCRWFTDAKIHNLAFMQIKIPQGTPNFQKGFKEGCATVLYSRGYGLYRTFYEYQFSPELIDQPDYFFGRKRGYNFCFGYITGGSGHFAKGWDAYIYGQGTPFDMGKSSIDKTVLGGNVLDSWGDMRGGVGASLGVLQKNRANNGGAMGGHIFYGNVNANSGNILGF